MPILISRRTRAIVAGITGNQGSFHTKLMLDYGTQIAAGVTPGKGGDTIQGVPVYDTVAAALEKTDANASIIFVPAPHAKESAMEAIDSGLNPVVVITEGIPARDAMIMVAYARERNVVIVASRAGIDRKSTRLNSSHSQISHAVFCLKKKKKTDGT